MFLTWFEMPRVYEDMPMWGAIGKPFQYIMSYDPETLKFAVSAKYPNTSKRIDLGEYYSEKDATLACETHYSNNRQ